MDDAASGRGPGRPRATLLDVAVASGVSRQTVSNVINNPGRVATQTLERVRADIDRLGFRPSGPARSLRRQRANALALQIETTASRTFGSILDLFLAALTATAQEQDAHVITFVAADDDAVVAAYERLIATQVVDGVVLTNTRHRDPRPAWLRSHDVPFVSFGRIWDEPSFPGWVDVDGRAGTAAGVRHLRERDYGRVAFLGWPSGSAVGDDRRAGWQDALEAFGQPADGLSASCGQDVGAAQEAAGTLLEKLHPGDAIVCVSDTLALGAALSVERRGLRLGRDIGVLGFDDCDFTSVFGLSSIRQPVGDIAAELVRQLESTQPPHRGVLLTPTVVPRTSTTR